MADLPPDWWTRAKEYLAPTTEENYFGVVPMVRNALTSTMNAAEVMGGYRSANEEDATKFLLDAWSPAGFAGAGVRPGLGTFGGRNALKGPSVEFAREAGWNIPVEHASSGAKHAERLNNIGELVNRSPDEWDAFALKPEIMARETGGWFMGEDTMPRFEISDLQSGWKNPDDPMAGMPYMHLSDSPKTTVGDIFEHPELFERYPDLADIQVRRPGIFDDVLGAYAHDKNTIYLRNQDPSDMRSTMLHELQHAIQSREDFSRGGNTEMFLDDAGRELIAQKSAAWGDLYKYDSDANLKNSLQDELAVLRQRYGYDIDKNNIEAVYRNMVKGIGPNSSTRMLKRTGEGVDPTDAHRWNSYQTVPDEIWNPMLNDITNNPVLSDYGVKYQHWSDMNSKSSKIESQAYKDYRDLAGEREARQVQARRDLYPEQWDEVPPWRFADFEDPTRSDPLFASRYTMQAESRDYPDVRLADRIDDSKVQQFLEDHGYAQYSGSGAKDDTFEFTPQGIRAYTTKFDANGQHGIEQKTFDVPTLKQLRTWMGY